MHKDVGKHFLLDESRVSEINSLLSKYNNCAECIRSGRQVNRNGGCEGCDLSMTHDERDAGWALRSAFEECMSLGFMTGGKNIDSIDMDDVPSKVWDEVYAKWSRLLDVGWTPSAWDGCSLCAWLANELGVRVVSDIGCELCPIYEGEWCRSIPEESKIHPEYDPSSYDNGVICDIEHWESRVKAFLKFIKTYCSRDGEGMLREDVIDCIMKYDGMIDVVGISLYLVRSFDAINDVVDELEKEGIVERYLDVRGIYSFRMVHDVIT